MASLHRGLLFSLPSRFLSYPQRCLHHPTATTLTTCSRHFTTSIRLRERPPVTKSEQGAATSHTSIHKGPVTPREAAAAAAAASQRANVTEPSRYAFVKSLATKPTVTTLYQAPSHFWFYFACWSSGLSILTWTVLTGPASMQQPEGVPVWVGYVFGGSYVLLGSMGLYLITKTPGIVNSIRVLPTVSAPPVAPGARPVIAAAPQPQLEVEIKRMLPFMAPKRIVTGLDKVSLKNKFSLPPAYVPELQRQTLQRAQEQQKRALRKFDMEHVMTMPFRKVGRGFMAFFRGVRSAWTDMGFGRIRVDGKEYKVDVTKGFAHDGFKSLEKLVAVEP